METSLIMLPVARSRDVVRLRQVMRQAATLLEFEPLERILLATAAFELAQQARRPTGRALAHIVIADDKLRLQLRSDPPVGGNEPIPLLLERPLPLSQRGKMLKDIVWILQQVSRLAEAGGFEELQMANRELLQVLQKMSATLTQPAEQPAPTPEADAA